MRVLKRFFTLFVLVGMMAVPTLFADEGAVTLNGFLEYEWKSEDGDAKLIFRDEASESKYLVELSDGVDVDECIGKKIAATGLIKAAEEGLSTFVLQSWKLIEEETPDVPDSPSDDDDDDSGDNDSDEF